MSVSVSMPQLGESVTEGTVTRWLKHEGDHVSADEPLLEVSTDKVDTEIPSPVSGILRGISVAEDETVAVGAELAVIDEDAAGDVRLPAAGASPASRVPAAGASPASRLPAAGAGRLPAAGASRVPAAGASPASRLPAVGAGRLPAGEASRACGVSAAPGGACDLVPGAAVRHAGDPRASRVRRAGGVQARAAARAAWPRRSGAGPAGLALEHRARRPAAAG